jgi:hypothetical protein
MAIAPRDIDAELLALSEKAKKVKTQQTIQLGELVQFIGADSLPSGPSPASSSPPSIRPRTNPKPSRWGPNAARRSFSWDPSATRRPHPANLLQDLMTTTARLRHLAVQRNRFN